MAFTIVKASELGCVLDCVLTTGLTKSGGAATDNAATLNAFLAAATATNPLHLIIDGGSLIGTALQIPATGHVTIDGLGWDTGFYIKSGANSDAINNFPTKNTIPFASGPPAPARSGGNVIVRNLMVNGNRGNGTTGNSNTGDPRGNPGVCWYTGISLRNLNHVLIDNVWMYDISSYGLNLTNIDDVVVDKYRGEAPSLAFNTDPIHFNGPCSNIRVTNGYFDSGDDAIALNCPEGDSGDISRIIVADCNVVNGNSLLRLYTSDGVTNSFIDSVSISNCYGNISSVGAVPAVLIIGNGNGAGAALSIGSVNVSNCYFIAPRLVWVSNNTNILSFNNVTFIPLGTTVGVQVVAGATLTTLKVNGLTAPSGTVGYLADAAGGCAIGAVLIDGFDPRNFTGLAGPNAFTQITAIGGCAVRASGFEIPDAKMLNNSDYLSATSHLPSIKIAGTVKTYTVI